MNQDLVVPKWFLQFCGAAASLFLITFLPWAVWQTRSSMHMQFKVEEISSDLQSVEKISESLDAVRAEQIRRSGNVAQVEQLTRTIEILNDSVRSLERRMALLEGQIRNDNGGFNRRE